MQENLTIGTSAIERQPHVITIQAATYQRNIRLRVAAYTRVSSDSKDQLNSFAAQNQYYTTLISKRSDWQMIDIYADEGITGTSTEKRDQFRRMMNDCRRGLIDCIVVKSISRFARNAKDCLEAIRELKSLGINVHFEREGIDTANVSSELITAIYAACAQKESESISGNMLWSYRHRMERGKFNTCKAPFGYRLEDGTLCINETEAEVVRLIFDLYLNGKGRSEIADTLRQLNAPTRSDVREWKPSTVYYILNNERYAGNARLGKFITTESFPHKKIHNHGEREQFYIRNSHPAILPPEVFERAQELSQKRLGSGHPGTAAEHPFRKKIFCGRCRSPFKRRMVRGKEYWVCYKHFENKQDCPTKPIPTSELEGAFCRLYYKLSTNREVILGQMISQFQTAASQRMLWSPDVVSLNKQISDLSRQNQTLTQLKQQGLVDPDIFIHKSNELARRIQQLKLEKERLTGTEDDLLPKTKELMELLDAASAFLECFDPYLFDVLVDHIVAEQDALHFYLKNGLQLSERLRHQRGR